MLNVGSCNVALVESTGASVSQADRFLCGTQGEKGCVTPFCSRSAAQIHGAGLTETPFKYAGEKSNRKAVALGEHLPTAHSTVLLPFYQYPAFQ